MPIDSPSGAFFKATSATSNSNKCGHNLSPEAIVKDLTALSIIERL